MICLLDGDEAGSDARHTMTTTTSHEEIAAALRDDLDAIHEFGYFPRRHEAYKAAAVAGLPVDDALAFKGCYSEKAIRDTYEEAASGRDAKLAVVDRNLEETEQRHQRYLDEKREKDISKLRERLGTDAPKTVLRRITDDDAALYGSRYLGHEGEWAEMPK